MNEPFEYEFTPSTFYADGALEVFVNRLNIMFNQNNFNERVNEFDNYIIGAVDRASGYGVRRDNGKGFFVANLSKRRHNIFFAPTRMPKEYIGFQSSGSQVSEDIVFNYITNAPTEVISNRAEVDYFKAEYGLDHAAHEVEICTYSIFDDILFVLAPTDNVQFTYIFVRLPVYGVTIIGFDAFSKRFTVYDNNVISGISDSMTNGSIKIDNDALVFGFNSDISPVTGDHDLVMAIDDKVFKVDCAKNRAYTDSGNILSINYAGDLLNKIFV
jgi:hypothetical protein